MLLLFFRGGGASAAAAAVAGGYEDAKKRRYVAKVGNRLLVFSDAAQALNAEILSAPEKKEPEKVIKVAEVKAKAKAHKQEAKVMELFRKADYEQVVKLYDDMLDEDDVEMLLLTL